MKATQSEPAGWMCPACRKMYDTYAQAKCCREIPIPVPKAPWRNVVFDSGRYYVCGLCHQVIPPYSSIVVEGHSEITGCDDLQVAHKQCYMEAVWPAPLHSNTLTLSKEASEYLDL